MKKIFFLIAMFAVIGLNLDAQQKNKEVALSSGQTLYENTSFLASDSLNTYADSTLGFVFKLNKGKPVKYDTKAVLDSLNGTPDFDVYLQYKVFGTDTWANIDTVYWNGTSSDTTIRFTQTTTAQYYSQLRWYIEGQASTGAGKLSEIDLKIYE